VTDWLNLALAAVVLALGAWVVLAREAFPAVVGFIAYGLLLTLVWVQLSGVDVALTEAAIGGGLTGVLLIGAVSRMRGTAAVARSQRPGPAMTALAAVLASFVTLVLGYCVLALPHPAPSLAQEVADNMASTGVGNPVTGVLLAFRSMDTLLEAVVLLIAVVGAWSLTPDRFWGGPPGTRQYADPNGILAYLARVLPPVGIVVGMYVFWIGADHPGGKFQGATILAAMWLLAVMAGLADLPAISRVWLRALLVLGPLVFIAIGLLGSATAGAFLDYPDGYAKRLILTIEFALMPSLTLILALLVAGIPKRPGAP
jgi:multisubunit Na+/H+ antiporter MnhB subunit